MDTNFNLPGNLTNSYQEADTATKKSSSENLSSSSSSRGGTKIQDVTSSCSNKAPTRPKRNLQIANYKEVSSDEEFGNVTEVLTRKRYKSQSSQSSSAKEVHYFENPFLSHDNEELNQMDFAPQGEEDIEIQKLLQEDIIELDESEHASASSAEKEQPKEITPQKEFSCGAIEDPELQQAVEAALAKDPELTDSKARFQVAVDRTMLFYNQFLESNSRPQAYDRSIPHANGLLRKLGFSSTDARDLKLDIVKKVAKMSKIENQEEKFPGLKEKIYSYKAQAEEKKIPKKDIPFFVATEIAREDVPLIQAKQRDFHQQFPQSKIYNVFKELGFKREEASRMQQKVFLQLYFEVQKKVNPTFSKQVPASEQLSVITPEIRENAVAAVQTLLQQGERNRAVLLKAAYDSLRQSNMGAHAIESYRSQIVTEAKQRENLN